jgi:2-hydroxy-6-oxonona-2,4-dienedioate hydrolase
MMLPRLGETLLHGMKHGLRLAPSQLIRRVSARFIGATGNLEKTMSDEYLDHLREMYAAEGYTDAYLATVRSLGSPRSFIGTMDVSRRLNRIEAPVLLIWGANDPLFPLEQARRAQALIPSARLAVIEGAGHTPQAEKPEEFNKQLAAFLRR